MNIKNRSLSYMAAPARNLVLNVIIVVASSREPRSDHVTFNETQAVGKMTLIRY